MIADWKTSEPEEYGHYIVTTKQGNVQKAYYGHPNSERKTAWYVAFVGGYEQIDVVAYDHLPKPYEMVFDAYKFIEGIGIVEKCNSIFRGLGLNEELIERLTYTDQMHIHDAELGRCVGDYAIVDHGLPVVSLFGYMAYPRRLLEQKVVDGRPRFWPTIVQRDKVGLEIRAPYATDALICWLDHHFFGDSPEARQRRSAADLSFEHGTHRGERWINIEFGNPVNVYETVRYINENFKEPK